MTWRASRLRMRAVCQFQLRWSTPEIRIYRQRFEWSSNMCWPIGREIGGFRSWSQANDRWELKITGPNGIHVGHKYLGMASCCEALLRPLLLDAKVFCELLHHKRYVRSAVHGPPTPADEQKYWLRKTQLRITYVQDFSVLRTSLLINRRNHSV